MLPSRAELTPSGRAALLGILNVTPDSFSDGGRWLSVDEAIQHGIAMTSPNGDGPASFGADLIDVGGESTRPGAARVDPTVEQGRVLPVIRSLAAEGVRVSIDTMSAATAAAALDAGAVVVNDVSGGLADPAMLPVVAEREAVYVAMHWRGHSEAMASFAHYDDAVVEVCSELERRVDAARAAGIRDNRLLLDPGLGFAKNARHDWSLLARLDAIVALGFPVLVGHSRKRFLAPFAPEGASALERDEASAMLSLTAALGGAWGVRVHDVRSSATALALAARLHQERP
ncbi:dihydropteroate synthase [Rathayibacter toxicus]|uniref:Dihydropteroate synthase n=1 Tax=Rathayibacter toxicus TaxID=145458 RepID=A0A0U1PVE0_9MICO|nr:dihydropteroate synthase [Rathayibacter toxicus]ALS57487.1 dihydropteroate synthase [Rathayibacter toxicus]KKM46807.1 dihydropteroate synthase [Rathayibacter toxicus]PPG20844.1 dihydropteroate synthase [Rathayibacter toxicus]PPG45947.1 dihydropteroate synthase [Rathayibacter toxicus]PPH62525.1 dihydropteroate synthase [Rathayibacter toxicus]